LWSFSHYASKLKRWWHIFSPIAIFPWLWGIVKSWLGIPTIRTRERTNYISFKEWWTMMQSNAMANRKAISTLTMLVSWTIWKNGMQESSIRNPPPTIVLELIGGMAKLWVTADVKHLSYVIMGE
jgi:hypothetical protein